MTRDDIRNKAREIAFAARDVEWQNLDALAGQARDEGYERWADAADATLPARESQGAAS